MAVFSKINISLFGCQWADTHETQAATQARDEALDDLQEWMGDFVSIARIALEDQPQYIEMLGIVESN